MWGVNYMRGWVFFTFTDDNFVSEGIAWFTRPHLLKPDDRPVSHTGITTGPNGTIEALQQGVVESDLAKYFNDPHVHIFFRCPQGYTEDMGNTIVTAAAGYLGEGYGYPLIVANFLAKNILGRIINKLAFNWPNRAVSWLLDSKRQAICSELVAMALQAVPWLKNIGCLKNPARMITPRDLSSDDKVFVPLKPA